MAIGTVEMTRDKPFKMYMNCPRTLRYVHMLEICTFNTNASVQTLTSFANSTFNNSVIQSCQLLV